MTPQPDGCLDKSRQTQPKFAASIFFSSNTFTNHCFVVRQQQQQQRPRLKTFHNTLIELLAIQKPLYTLNGKVKKKRKRERERKRNK